MTTTKGFRRSMRLGGTGAFAVAAAVWFATGGAAAATNLAPAKTAWYDNSGAQNVTGVTTPSAAQPGELEVSYAPASATVPQQTLPSTPALPGAPVAPPSGNTGGNTLGNTLAFAAVEYDVPLEVGGQSIDPSSIVATLTLTLDSSSANVTNGDLLACPTNTTLWTAGGDQDSGAAPQYSCTAGAVSGNVDSAGHTVSFALSSAQENSLSAGSFSLVIVPGSSPSGAFQAVFVAPSIGSLAVTEEAPLGDEGQNLTSPSPGGDQGSTDQSGTSIGSFGLQTFSPSTAVSTPATTAPATTATTGAGSAPSSPLYRAAAPASLRGGLGSSAQRTLALVVLLAVGALLVLGSSRPVRAPRSLRAVTGAPPAGAR